ncbi:hypothetical protein PspLS_07860 [Pyricularia sp. CBS 133598]|nr:hypothetical protein PspLS_07860 [Pyricularia sp. CBS 133598]
MSLMTDSIICELLCGKVKRRELSNSAALEALARFCVTDKRRLQIEAELEAHLLPLMRRHEEVPPPKPRAESSVIPRTRPHWGRAKTLNDNCANTCTRTAKLISLSLGTIVKLYQALVEHPNLVPSAKYLRGILASVSCAIHIWAETVDGVEYRKHDRPELNRNDRRLARAAHMQYCGQILLTVCRLTWPEGQHEWIKEQQIIFDKEVEDFSEAFIFDGSLTYRYILEARKTVLDGGGPRNEYIILQILDRSRQDKGNTKEKWYQPDPALPLLQDLVELTKKRKRENGEKGYDVDDSDGDQVDNGHVKGRKKAGNGKVKGSASSSSSSRRKAIMKYKWRFPSESVEANSTSRALQDPELQQQLQQLKQIREKEQRLLQERCESLDTWFGPRSFRQLGLFFAGAGFLACTVGITRRAVLRKQVAAAPKFFSPSKYIKPEPRVDSKGNTTKVIDPEAEGGPLAVQALGLATLNVFSFAIMMTGGLSWAFDISGMDDLRVLARRKIHTGEGDPDPGGEKEIEDWMSNMMLRSKDSSDQDTATDGTATTESEP